MNRSFLVLIVIVIVTMLVVGGIQLFLSLSGANVEFSPAITNTNISSDLGSNTLNFIENNTSNLLITNEELNLEYNNPN